MRLLMLSSIDYNNKIIKIKLHSCTFQTIKNSFDEKISYANFGTFDVVVEKSIFGVEE